MAFANFILAAFLLVSILVFIVLVMLMRQIKKNGSLPPEKMTTLAAILFIPALLVFALISKGITDWRTELQNQKERVEIDQFVRGVYKPLSTAQASLLQSFSEMRALLQDTEALELEYPNHAPLIADVTKEWRAGQIALYNVYKDVDKEVRRAWISFNTMDQQDVLAKFGKQAVQLETDIRKEETKYQRHIRSVQDKLIQDLDSARKLLDANRKPPKSKKQKVRNQTLREKIRPFNDRTIAELVGFLNLIDKRLKNEVEALQRLIRVSGQQGTIIRSHLEKNRDLERPLTLIINKWKALEEKSQRSLNQVLYAIEAEYVALKLGLSQENPAIKAMHKSLLINIPHIVGKATKQRRSIDQSYKIKRD